MSVFDPNNGSTGSGGGLTEEQYNNLVQDGELDAMSVALAQQIVAYGSVPGEIKEFIGNVPASYGEIAGTRKNTIGFTSYGKRTNAFKSLAMATHANVNFGSYERDMGLLTPYLLNQHQLVLTIPVINSPNERLTCVIMTVGNEGQIDPPDAQATRAYIRPIRIKTFTSDGNVVYKQIDKNQDDFLLMVSEMYAPPMYRVAYSTGEVSDGTEQASVDRVQAIITSSTNRQVFDGDLFCFKVNATGAYYMGFVDYGSSLQFMEMTPVLNEDTGVTTLTLGYLSLNDYDNNSLGAYIQGVYTNGIFYGSLGAEVGFTGYSNFNRGTETHVIVYSNALFTKLSETTCCIQGAARGYIVPAFRGTFNIGDTIYFLSANKKIYKALNTLRGDHLDTPTGSGGTPTPIYNIEEVCEADFDLIKYCYVVGFDNNSGSTTDYPRKWVGLKNVGYVNEQSCTITEMVITPGAEPGTPGINKTVNNVYEVFDLSNISTVSLYTKKLAIKVG